MRFLQTKKSAVVLMSFPSRVMRLHQHPLNTLHGYLHLSDILANGRL